jgi:hypothetical protein
MLHKVLHMPTLQGQEESPSFAAFLFGIFIAKSGTFHYNGRDSLLAACF